MCKEPGPEKLHFQLIGVPIRQSGPGTHAGLYFTE